MMRPDDNDDKGSTSINVDHRAKEGGEKRQQQRQEMEDMCCPICFHTPNSATSVDGTSTITMVYSSICGHSFCRSCIERYLFQPSLLGNPPTTRIVTSSSSSTTTTLLNLCPLCRAELSYFDLRTTTPMNELLVDPINTTPLDNALDGAIFAERGSGGIGWGSIHFPARRSSSSSSSSPAASQTSQTKENGVTTLIQMNHPEATTRRLPNNNDNRSTRLDSSVQCGGGGTQSSSSATTTTTTTPYINLTQVTAPISSSLNPRPILYFNISSRYHPHTHTWEGQSMYQDSINNNNNNNNSEAASTTTSTTFQTHIRVVLTFSDNFQSIPRGVMTRTVTKTLPKSSSSSSQEDAPDATATQQHHQCFDGDWKIKSCSDTDGSSSSTNMSNHNSDLPSATAVSTSSLPWNPPSVEQQHICVTQSLAHDDATDCWYRLLRPNDDNNHACSIFMVHPASTTDPSLPLLVADWDWTKQPNGPVSVGSSLMWHTYPTDDDERLLLSRRRPVMEWIRQTPAPPVSTVTKSIIPMGENAGRKFRRMDTKALSSINSPHPAYHSNTVWGNVFCQQYKVGLASYHFVAPPTEVLGSDDSDPNNIFSHQQHGQVYISYEHPNVCHWPLLDDGRPIPSRVYFRNISFPDAHTFRGHICWMDDFGTTWQNHIRWEYEMKFDRRYMCIVSGDVHCVTTSNDSSSMQETTTALEMMSTYGEGLIYCNAGLFDHFLQTEIWNSRKEVENQLRNEEGASDRLWSMILQLIRTARSAGRDWTIPEHPIDFNDR